jgi:hypothetical protein
MSTRLQLVTSYLIVSGMLALGFALYQLFEAARASPSGIDFGSATGPATAALGAVGCLWLAAGILLARRQRWGVVLATVAVALQLINSWRGPSTLAFSLIALAAVLSTWREMTA